MARPSVRSVERAIVACGRCPRLRRYCAAVAETRVARFRHEEYWGRPVPGFGDPAAKLLVVGLAPAAHGANRTGRMFTGDSSGDWLFEALHRFGFASQAGSTGRGDGLTLRECYIAAAARCAPPGNKPLGVELDRCRSFLEAELAALRALRVVLTLGGIAHRSYLKAAGWWARFTPRERPTFGHGVVNELPGGLVLLASYHPSRQNTNTGRLTRAMWHDVFRAARALVDAA
jgi:uracil-DNA glycosylase family 4